jgi:hypothetical protein
MREGNSRTPDSESGRHFVPERRRKKVGEGFEEVFFDL